MQNGAQNSATVSGRLVGFVRVLVGGKIFDVPVQAVPYEKDGDHDVGGFFAHERELGILVHEGDTEKEIQAQVEAATVEAVKHLSQQYLN